MNKFYIKGLALLFLKTGWILRSNAEACGKNIDQGCLIKKCCSPNTATPRVLLGFAEAKNCGVGPRLHPYFFSGKKLCIRYTYKTNKKYFGDSREYIGYIIVQSVWVHKIFTCLNDKNDYDNSLSFPQIVIKL